MVVLRWGYSEKLTIDLRSSRMDRQLKLLSSTWLLVFLGISTALADDGALFDLGAPRMMHGESSIRMVREYVHATTHRDYSHVYCRFVFKNEGPAANVRIGFPDGNEQGFEEGNERYPAFSHFVSTVDGRVVRTRVEITKTEQIAPTFHVKTVRFAKGQTRVIEDWYDCPFGGGATSTKPAVDKEIFYNSCFQYTMESGASWKGTIGSAVVEVEFLAKALSQPKLIPNSESINPRETTRIGPIPKNWVAWSAFAIPHLRGRVVRFSRRNFKPTKNDNVVLWFDWAPYEKSHWYRLGESYRATENSSN